MFLAVNHREDEALSWREEDMYPYVMKDLRIRFPAYDGWEIFPQDAWSGYRPDFVVERRRHGKIQRVVVEVKADCKVRLDYIRQLNSYARNLAGRNVEIVGKILVVPAGTDTSNVPYDIEIMYLRAFKCEDQKIIWYG